MEKIVNELICGAPLSNYPVEIHSDLLNPLALAKKEAQILHNSEKVEKINNIISQLVLVQRVPLLVPKSRNLLFDRHRSFSKIDNYNLRFLEKETERAHEIRMRERDELTKKQAMERESLKPPKIVSQDFSNEIEAVEKIRLNDAKSKLDRKSSMQIINCLNTKKMNEKILLNYKEEVRRMDERHKEELERFDRKTFLQFKEMRSNSQTLPRHNTIGRLSATAPLYTFA